jgi:heavy metal sensor kinase
VPERRHFSRGLRFTLTAVYTVVFTLLLVGVSLIFRQTLAASLDRQAREDLNQNWAILKAYLRIDIENGQPNLNWYNDHNDPEENNDVARVRSVLEIANEQGNTHGLETSPQYQALGMDSPAVIRSELKSPQPVWRWKRDPKGTQYLIRSSFVYDERGLVKFYVAIGLSLAEQQKLLRSFTWLTIGLAPLVFLIGGMTGWFVAGRALTPVLEIASTAERISGSNLSLRIPSRGTRDELDYLIETFNQMIERLEGTFQQIRQFSADVSHELRTPITVIRGQLEVALFTAQTADQYRDAIVNSLADIERLSQIVRALLLLSQSESGQVVLQRQRLDLVEVTREITEQFEIPAEGAAVRLEFRAAVPRCEGDFDRVQIDRMLSNLLSNAIKFTPEGGLVRVTVGRLSDPTPGQAEICVEDTGRGIPAEHLPHIFDRFYRVRGKDEQASPEKGLGLGLSFVAWIVRAHGGTVDVQSEAGKGTKFRLRLPLANAPAELPPAETQGPEVMNAV